MMPYSLLKKVIGNRSVLAGLGLLLSGCSLVGPNYSAVEPEAPAAWQSGLAAGLAASPTDAATLASWWRVLDDPLLENLENEAIAGNLSLKQASARVREARALRGLSQAALLPRLNGSASALESRSSENSSNGREGELYAVGFDAGWELDIFGGVTRAVEAADADLGAGEASLNDVLVSLTAEVGLNYIELRTSQARLASARKNLASQEQTNDLYESRFQAGLINEMAVQQAHYNQEHTRSQIPQLEKAQALAMNRLAVLLGKKPGALAAQLAPVQPVPATPLSIAVGVPAETLRRRPDIRRAERELAAQTARIGVATADLYPKFRLAGSIGLESLALEKLPEWASRTFRLGPSVSWHIFDANAIRRNIEVQNIRQEQALLRYQAAVLQALEEVENGLTAFALEQERLQALSRAADAAAKAEHLAQDLFQAGLTDYSKVLEAQRFLLSSEDELAQSTGAVSANLVRLYKALGGGWTAEEQK